jgi:protein-disulfide isomerase
MRLTRLAIFVSVALLPLATVRGQTAAPAAPPPVTTIVVFSDFECPYSAQLSLTLQSLQAHHPGALRVIYKQSPLTSIHPEAVLAHRAALAAGRQGRYDAMAELLYANQTRQDRVSILAYARQLHLDLVRFRRDLDSPAVAAQLAADMEESRNFAIEQTPTLFVNGRPYIGIQSEETLAALLNRNQPSLAPSSSPAEAVLSPALTAEIQSSPSASRGPEAAPLTIVEFTDFQCPYCRAAVSPMEQLMSARGRQVHWVFRSFPLDFHPDSELANEAALAAGEQGKFWEMHDLLFSHQSALKIDSLRSYADQLHLDMKLFDQALSSHRFAGQIAADRALGAKVGVNGTPTFVVDGRIFSGVRELPELLQLADSHIAAAASKSAPVSAAVPVPLLSLPNQQVLGPASAVPLTLTWFVDVRSTQAAAQSELLHRLDRQYNGKMRVLFRAFPLESHADGRLASAALIAALAQHQFWPMFDAVAQRRDLLDRAKLQAIAASLHLDGPAFESALDSSIAEVALDQQDASRRGIQGVPVLFLNEQRVDGLQRDQFYTTILDHELKADPAEQASQQP